MRRLPNLQIVRVCHPGRTGAPSRRLGDKGPDGLTKWTVTMERKGLMLALASGALERGEPPRGSKPSSDALRTRRRCSPRTVWKLVLPGPSCCPEMVSCSGAPSSGPRPWH